MARVFPQLAVFSLVVLFLLIVSGGPAGAVELDVIEQKVLQAVEERMSQNSGPVLDEEGDELAPSSSVGPALEVVPTESVASSTIDHQPPDTVIWQIWGGRISLRRFQGQWLLSFDFSLSENPE
ncbi:MAG TPA: hypothetical protein VF209_02615 [Patescibacteria group bacterium]